MAEEAQALPSRTNWTRIAATVPLDKQDWQLNGTMCLPDSCAKCSCCNQQNAVEAVFLESSFLPWIYIVL